MNFLILLLILFVIALGFAFYAYNRLTQLRNTCDTEWAQVDVNLKKRADLIPNLIEVVKGYAKHEQDTLERVSEARTRAMRSDEHRADDEKELSRHVAEVFMLREKYPDLKANENFLKLSSELFSLEAEIARRRDNYNNVAKAYNDYILKFPANVISSMIGFSLKEYFEFTGSRDVPVVEMGQG
ncbi:MAG TPA: LemA family protein [Firmicutes bacterium]|nr:LemA family protein [Bacillota bacterium]